MMVHEGKICQGGDGDILEHGGAWKKCETGTRKQEKKAGGHPVAMSGKL